MNKEKPSLPSFKDLIEKGPGLIDYSTSFPLLTTAVAAANRINRHKRRFSDHVLRSLAHHDKSMPLMPPIIPSSEHQQKRPSNVLLLLQHHRIAAAPSINITDSLLPLKMQSLSLDATSDTVPPFKKRTHSRSYSDLTVYPYSHHYVHHQSSLITIVEGKENFYSSPLPSHPPTLIAHSSSSSSSSSSTVTTTSSTKQQEEYNNEQDCYSDENTTITTSKYHCPYCPKGFTRPSSLQTHVYCHTGEKPFRCLEPSCGRTFNVQSNLRRHLRIHNKQSIIKNAIRLT